MKRFIIIILALLTVSFSAFAQSQDSKQAQQSQQQNQHHGYGRDWQQRMKAEKIAYLTAAMGLTPEEAQKFWPLYNQAEAESGRATAESMAAYVELTKAVKEGKSGKDLEALVNRYTKAEAATRAIDQKYAPQYMKILSAEKVAKLFVGEEEFRRIQMRKFGGK
ncbi:MAG: hypothetical protein MJZ16_02690 [Bacteroidales bacterium]|nr:hypothetical protein [Bacteroidales bacterium]